MANEKVDILFPVGRMVAGDLYEPNDKDADGNPLLVKNGDNKGQARVEYYLAVAIPKEPGRQWWQTEWGAKIWQCGSTAFPQACQMPTFSWKIKDGDDAQPRMGRNGKPSKPYNQREGWAGHWILSISSGYAPKIVNSTGTAEITEKGAVKPGYYVQVFGNVSPNGSTQRPGVYLNHNGIALAGYGEEIRTGVDLGSVGFGASPLPAGASAVPLAGMTTAPGAAMPGTPAAGPAGYPQPGQMPGVPAAGPVGFPGGYPQPGQMPGAVGVPAGPAAMPVPGAAVPGMPTPGVPIVAGVTPNPAFLQVPGTPAAPAVPVAPVAPPAAPQRRMTAAANGATYEQMIAAGWTDQTLVQHGMMLV